jgi:hypothetical protein
LLRGPVSIREIRQIRNIKYLAMHTASAFCVEQHKLRYMKGYEIM